VARLIHEFKKIDDFIEEEARAVFQAIIMFENKKPA
jgi:hypothetical protein